MNSTTLRRVVLTALLALLVATAGCNGLGGDGGTASPTAGGGDDGTPATTGSDYDVAGEELDGENLTDSTTTAVMDGGSYTTESTLTATTTQQGQEQTTTSNRTLRVDMDAGTGLREQSRTQAAAGDSQTQSVVVYTAGNTSYRKFGSGTQAQYDRQEGPPQQFGDIRPVNVTSFNENYTQIVDGFTWERNGTTTDQGTTVTTYSLTGVADKEILGLGNATIEETSGALRVDGDGVLREVSVAYTATGNATTSVDLTTTVSDVGSTTVSEPDWTSQAKDS